MIGLRRAMRACVERFPRVAQAYRGMRDELAMAAPAVPTPWGFTLTGNPLMASGNFEPAETQLVRRLLRDVEVLVNIGANVGYYCCHALSMKKAVIAFEPMQANLQYLCRNVFDNGWSCEVFPIAATDHVGVMKMYGSGTGASLISGWAGVDEGYHTLVPCSTLDVILGERLKGKKILIIIDVEGAELSVLRGASCLLSSEPKPSWLIEISSAQHHPLGRNPDLASTFNVMFEAGYDAVTADLEETPVWRRDAEAAANGTAFATHNFIFRAGRESVPGTN